MMEIPENRGTVTPASREKLDAEIAKLVETCANPRKLRDLIVLRLAMEREHGE